MAAENAYSGFIKDTKPELISEKASKKLPSKKVKENIDIEEFAYKADEK